MDNQEVVSKIQSAIADTQAQVDKLQVTLDALNYSLTLQQDGYATDQAIIDAAVSAKLDAAKAALS